MTRWRKPNTEEKRTAYVLEESCVRCLINQTKRASGDTPLQVTQNRKRLLER